MAKKTRRKATTTRRRRRGTIGSVTRRRRSSGSRGGGMMATAMEAGKVGIGLVAGQYIGQKLSEKVEALQDGKMRGAALIGVGVLGAKYVPASMRGIAMGVAASGVYQLAKEMLPPGTIAGIGELSPADVDLIESMALESEVNGLDGDMRETVDGLDGDAGSTVTGMDDDEDGEDADY